MGLAPIPLPPRSKDPGFERWQETILTTETLDTHFPAGQARNVGILNGTPSGNILDVDLDCPEARRIAPQMLPATGWVFGRKSSPRSHWIYRADRPLAKAQEEHADLDGTMLLELRGNGGLTVYPPSTHVETGERIAWDQFTAPAEVTLADLQRVIGELAAASLMARHWPVKGQRDKAAMALAGGLIRAGWTREQVVRFIEAVAVAAGDEEVRMRMAKADPTARKLDEGKDVIGWPSLAKLVGQPAVDLIRKWLGLAEVTLGELPVPEPTPWPAPPEDEAFHGLAGQIVHTIEPASEADPVALLVQALVMFGNIIGRTAHFTVEGDRHHGNEFTVLVGRTSKARKGTSYNRVIRLFQEAEEEWEKERVQSGLSSGEGLIWAVRDPIQKRERVKEHGQVRYEEVEADPGVTDKRLLVYEPEYANVLKQTERQGNTLSVILRQAWDGLDLRALTKNSPARATGAHISLIGHITADELRRCLTQTESANGYGNRHLWICADRSKLLPEGGRLDPFAWERLKDNLAKAINFARAAKEVRRNEEAREIWRAVYGQLSEGKPGLAGALLARAEAHVMRLALLYALLDRSAEMQAPHLLAALALWDYVERSVMFVFGDSLGDDVADELLRLLRSCPKGVTRTQIRDFFGRHQSADRIGQALGLLLQHRLARCEPEQTGGRTTERWFAGAPKGP
jgi:hypothetical protein